MDWINTHAIDRPNEVREVSVVRYKLQASVGVPPLNSNVHH